jgi:hypothetical protein
MHEFYVDLFKVLKVTAFTDDNETFSKLVKYCFVDPNENPRNYQGGLAD